MLGTLNANSRKTVSPFVSALVFIFALIALTAPFVSSAQTAQTASTPSGNGICCLCQQASNRWCVNFTGVSNCANFLSAAEVRAIQQSSPDRLGNFLCSGDTLSSSQCAAMPSGGATGQGRCPAAPIPASQLAQVLQQAPATSASPTQAAAPASASGPVIPQLSVPIPGLTFGSMTDEAGCVQIPWIAQYISAIYRYLIGLSVLAATIMIVYGGFLYLIGAGTGEVSKGKQAIQDAILGMLVIFAAFLILHVVNPETLNMRALCLGSVVAENFSIQEQYSRSESGAESSVHASSGGGGGGGGTPESVCPASSGATPTATPGTSVRLSGSWSCAGWRSTMRHENGNYFANCADGYRKDGASSLRSPDALCASIAGTGGSGMPPGGAFGLYIRGMTDGCRSKFMNYIDGLDGLTYGLDNLTADNMPRLMQLYANADSSLFQQAFQSASMSEWFTNSTINTEWFCQHSMSDKGLVCNTGFRNALIQAACKPVFQREQVRYAFELYQGYLNTAGAQRFQGAYGKIMWAIIMHNPGTTHVPPTGRACQNINTLLAGCSNTDTDAGKIRCILGEGRNYGTFANLGCRNGVRGAQRRTNAIKQALSGIDASTPFVGQTFEQIASVINYSSSGGSAAASTNPASTAGASGTGTRPSTTPAPTGTGLPAPSGNQTGTAFLKQLLNIASLPNSDQIVRDLKAVTGLSNDRFNAIVTASRSNRPMVDSARETLIKNQIIGGNYPRFLSNMVRIDASRGGHQISYWVTPDVLSVGTDADFVRVPMYPGTAQSIADHFGMLLPTKTMADDIIRNGTRVNSVGFSPVLGSRAHSYLYIQSNQEIERARGGSGPPSGLIYGGKKFIILTNQSWSGRTTGGSPCLGIYGPFFGNQGYSPCFHDSHYVDYSHGVTLVGPSMLVDNERRNVADILADPQLYSLISHVRITDPKYHPE